MRLLIFMVITLPLRVRVWGSICLLPKHLVQTKPAVIITNLVCMRNLVLNNIRIVAINLKQHGVEELLVSRVPAQQYIYISYMRLAE